MLKKAIYKADDQLKLSKLIANRKILKIFSKTICMLHPFDMGIHMRRTIIIMNNNSNDPRSTYSLRLSISNKV